MAIEFSNVTLEAEHVPETSRTLEPDHTISEQELPGVVRVYLVLDGARLLFTEYKASKVFDALDAREQPAEPSAPTQGGTVATTGTTGGGTTSTGPTTTGVTGDTPPAEQPQG